MGYVNNQLQTLINGAGTANQWYASLKMFAPNRTTVMLNVSAACTVDIEVSIDGTNWYEATLDGTATPAKQTFAGAGTLAVTIGPASYVRVQPSAALTTFIAQVVAAE